MDLAELQVLWWQAEGVSWVDTQGTRYKKHCTFVQIDSLTVLPLLHFFTFLSLPYSSLVLTLTLFISVHALIFFLCCPNPFFH